MQETRVQSLGWENPLEKEMATHSSTLAWKIPLLEEPGRLQCKESETLERLQFSNAWVILLFFNSLDSISQGMGLMDHMINSILIFCHPAYLTYMQRISCEMLGWMKHKLESKLLGEL